MRRLALLVAFVLSSGALAANPKAAALAKDADRLYRDNKYKEAAETLKEAYEAEPVGLYLYNIARAFDQAGELESSQEYYRRYVALPSADTQPDLLKKANLAMDRIRTLLARSTADKEAREAEKRRLEDDARKAEARADAEANEARRQRREFEAKEKERKDAEQKKVNGRKLAAYVTGGTAVLGLGMALGFGIGANGNREAFRTATTLEDKERFKASTQATAAVSDISLIVGIAASVATVILFPKGEEFEKSVTLGLAPMPGGGGFASVEGKF